MFIERFEKHPCAGTQKTVTEINRLQGSMLAQGTCDTLTTNVAKVVVVEVQRS
jgi:hypothetical protein